MRASILSLASCVSLAALPSRATAQVRDMGSATPIKVAIHVSSVRLAGDTVTVSYIVENLAKPISGEDFRQLLVDTPAPAISVDTPAVTKTWETAAVSRGLPTAKWTLYNADLIHPGQSSPPLTYRAVGLTGLVRYWAVPDLAAHPPVGEAEDKPVPSGFKKFADSGMTVGVVPPPTNATSVDLLSRVRGFVGYGCGASQLITNNGICNSLNVKLDAAGSAIGAGNAAAARGSIGAFLSELSAQRGKFVSDEAYALLYPNAAYLLSRLP